MINKKDFEEIKKEMELIEEKREETIQLSRETISISKQIIYAAQRNDFKACDDSMKKIKAMFCLVKMRSNYFMHGCLIRGCNCT